MKPNQAEVKLALEVRQRASDKLGKELFSRERNTMSTPIFDAVTNVTTDGEGNPTAKPTAKVAAGALTGLALTVVVAVLTAITPDLLQFLGPWAGPAFAGIGALAVALGAYIKKPTGEIS